MEIFGVGPGEIVLIVAIVLIVFGPERLPEIMGQAGRIIREVQRMSSGLTEEFQRSLQAELNATEHPQAPTPAPQLTSAAPYQPAPAIHTEVEPAPPQAGEAVPSASAPRDYLSDIEPPY